MTIKDTKRLITSPNLINDLVYHDITKMQREVGPLWKYMDGSMIPESDVTVLVRDISKAHLIQSAFSLIIRCSIKHDYS